MSAAPYDGGMSADRFRAPSVSLSRIYTRSGGRRRNQPRQRPPGCQRRPQGRSLRDGGRAQLPRRGGAGHAPRARSRPCAVGAVGSGAFAGAARIVQPGFAACYGPRRHRRETAPCRQRRNREDRARDRRNERRFARSALVCAAWRLAAERGVAPQPRRMPAGRAAGHRLGAAGKRRRAAPLPQSAFRTPFSFGAAGPACRWARTKRSGSRTGSETGRPAGRA